MATPPGTIWQKIQSQFGAPPQWVPVANFALGVPGTSGGPGAPGIAGPRGATGATGTVTAFNTFPPATPTTIDSAAFYSVASGANAQTTLGAILAILGRGYIDGLTLSNDAITPNTVVDIAAGVCTDSADTSILALSSLIGKNLAVAWAAGSGSGGLFTGAIANSTWYHVFLIQKASDGTLDAGFDTSITAANKPAGYGLFRRLGSVLTDGAAHILAFHQYGDEFYWDTSIIDINATNPGTSAVSATLSVPTGLKVKAIIDGNFLSSTTNSRIYLSSLDSADLATSQPNAIESSTFATTVIEGVITNAFWTNTSAQIRYRLQLSDANMVVKIRTRGWLDLRGRNS